MSSSKSISLCVSAFVECWRLPEHANAIAGHGGTPIRRARRAGGLCTRHHPRIVRQSGCRQLSLQEPAGTGARGIRTALERPPGDGASCVIGETVRGKLFGTQDPIGCRIRLNKLSCHGRLLPLFCGRGRNLRLLPGAQGRAAGSDRSPAARIERRWLNRSCSTSNDEHVRTVEIEIAIGVEFLAFSSISVPIPIWIPIADVIIRIAESLLNRS